MAPRNVRPEPDAQTAPAHDAEMLAWVADRFSWYDRAGNLAFDLGSDGLPDALMASLVHGYTNTATATSIWFNRDRRALLLARRGAGTLMLFDDVSEFDNCVYSLCRGRSTWLVEPRRRLPEGGVNR